MTKPKAVLIEGDGIGPEISESVVTILEHAGASIEWVTGYAGAKAVEKFDDPLPHQTLEAIRSATVALKGPLSTEIGQQGGQAKGFRSLNVRLRKELDLFANVRPIKTLPNLRTKFENVDLVIIRENTEGLYSGLEHEIVPGVVTSLKVSTRAACTRVAEYAFSYAERSKRKKITGVHKANIMKLSDGLALECYREVANQHPEIEYEERIVDAAAMHLVMHPERFDMLLMENLYGDILSDLAAGLIGGLGLAASANIGTEAAVFEAVHGSAPDIAGKGLANPTALLFSATQLLRHLGQLKCATDIEAAAYATFSQPELLTPDLGGRGTTKTFTKAICDRLGASS